MNCHWQTVPHDWPGGRESSVAKFRPRTWNRLVGAGRRAWNALFKPDIIQRYL